MVRRKQEATPPWFIKDKAIEDPGDDRLNHRSVAATLVAAIESAQPPCMIGLLAPFGKGKSSTTNLAAAALKGRAEYDTVTVSADKHAGTERARNIVHAVAAALTDLPKIDRDEVGEKLRPLRQATQVAVADPTETAWSRLASGRYSQKRFWFSLLPFGVIFAALLLAALVTEGTLSAALALLGLCPVFVWVAGATFAGPESPVGALVKSGLVTDHQPRAEAADEIEEVFGSLIDYHADQRGRKLVVFVDDIDRLAKDDLLDALRALRSLQSVPRGREPIFVISCNESILRTAIGTASRAPASSDFDLQDRDGELGEGGERDDERGDAPEAASQASESPGHVLANSEHEHPALAFIDKLLTVRVEMPPTLRGDMRRFALDVIGTDHPLRGTAVDVDQIVGILIHDSVDDARSVIRLLNRFIASYLMAEERELDGAVARHDITHHVDVLAQLCVLLDEFPHFHDEVTENPVVLSAAHKVVLRRTDLEPSEAEALERSACFTTDLGDPSGFRCVNPGLRRYLSGTVRRVRLPADIGPIVYFAATPGGRVLGADLRNRLMSAVRSGDPSELSTVLAEVPADKLGDTAGEVADALDGAAVVDATTYIAAVAPNLGLFTEHAGVVAEACADLIDRAAAGDVFAPEELTAVLDHTVAARHDLLCRQLLDEGGSAPDTNRRRVVAADYLGQNPQVRPKLEPPVVAWLEELPEAGSWSLGRPWLDVAEQLDDEDFGDLRRSAVTAMALSIGSEKEFMEGDERRLVALARSCVSGHTAAAPSSARLARKGPNTLSTFVLLWGITGHPGNPVDARFAAVAATHADLSAEARGLAVRLVARWVDVWKDATSEPGKEGETTPLAPDIINLLVKASADPVAGPAVAEVLAPLTRDLGEAVTPLLEAATAGVATSCAAGDLEYADVMARALVEALACLDTAAQAHYVAALLEPLNSEADVSAPGVELALRLVPAIAELSGGESALSTAASAWTTAIQRTGEGEHEARIAGLVAVAGVCPEVTGGAATQLLTNLKARLDAGDDPSGRLSALVQYPWPEAMVGDVLSQVDVHWDSVDETDRNAALRLARRAPDDASELPRFHDRMIAAVVAEPAGAVSTIAAGEADRMKPTHVAELFAAAAGEHQKVTARWARASEDELADTFSPGRVTTAARAEALLAALPQDRQQAAAAVILSQLCSLEASSPEVIPVVAERCDDAGSSSAATQATQLLEDGQPALPALRVLAALPAKHIDLARVDQVAAERLEEASDQEAELYGSILASRRLSRELEDGLRRLRKADSSAASAFDAAATRRHR